MTTPFNYERPNWAPLEQAVRAAGLPMQTCGEFMWMCEQSEGVHHYKHSATRLYAVLTVGTPSDEAARRVTAARTFRRAETHA